MASWNLSFDMAAIFFLLLLFVWYFNEKRVPMKSHTVFLYFLLTTFLATALEITATLLARDIDVVGYDMVYNILNIQSLAVNFVPIIFAHYLLLLANVDIRKNTPARLIIGLGIVVDLVIVLLNPFLHWAFTFEDGTFHMTRLGGIMYIVDAVMLILSLYVMITARKRFMFVKLGPLIFIFTCGVLASAAQVFFYFPLLNCMLAALCMTLYHYQQNSGLVMDMVTKQFNRRFMGDYIRNKYLEKKPFGVIVLAMDDFKFINKNFGVEHGDNLLYQVGYYLEHTKGQKAVFRLGSDQFCVIYDKHMDKLEQYAAVMQERFRHPWYDEVQKPIMMSASICCISCPQDAARYTDLIEVIDYSMSVAKKTRKGLVTMATDVDLTKIQKDKAIEKAVKLAMDKDELQVYYQPIFSVEKDVYNSAEALVRLHNKDLGWISPEDFIPIAEKNGLIVEMGEMILEKVCRFIRDFKLSETSVEYIEINISPMQLVQPDFYDRVRKIMERYDVKPNQINMEITETATVSMASTVTENIAKLVEYGISFSLDDYGSGNANIDYINRMPFKIINLDKYIIWDSFANSKAGITLEYTIRMLNALELNIVAEGIETEDMKTQLAEYGCHYMQGWLYSKAVPDKDFVKLLGKTA